MPAFNSVAVIGAGAWGTALATVAARAGRTATLCARADVVLVATPAQHLREAVKAIAAHLREATPVIACAKGIEHGTHQFMTEVIAEAAPHAMPAIPSGPSFAAAAARGFP